MKEIKTYQCDNCKSIHTYTSNIYKCFECGCEICDECCSFNDSMCNDCYENKLDEDDDE